MTNEWNETEWRMHVGLPLAYTVVGFLRTNYGPEQDAEFRAATTEQLEEVVNRHMPIMRMTTDERRVLLEEVRVLLDPGPWAASRPVTAPPA